MTNLNLTVLFITAFSVLIAGCNSGQDGIKLIPVTGVVTYQGDPIQDGVIRLVPAPGTEAPVRVRKIKQGAYQFEGRSAVAVGSYRVEISAYRLLQGAAISDIDPIAAESAREQFLPKQFNSDSQIDSLIVGPDDSGISHDFEL